MKIPADTVNNLNAATIVEAGAAAIRGGDCTIDFSGVVRCDTAAVACVLAWMRIAQTSGRKLSLVALPRDLLSQAKLYGVDQLMDGAGRPG
jgi:phospholipid transport system transporter-binding protein